MYCQCFCQLMRRARPRSSSLGLGLPRPTQSFVTRPSMSTRSYLRFSSVSLGLDNFHVGLGPCNRRHFNINSAAFMSPTFQRSEQMVNNRLEVEDAGGQLDQVKQKILFNSVLERELMNNSWLKTKISRERSLKKERYQRNVAKYKHLYENNAFPIALKYMMDSKEYNVGVETERLTLSEKSDRTTHETVVQLPYSVHNNLNLDTNRHVASGDAGQAEPRVVAAGQSEADFVVSEGENDDASETARGPRYNWMTDYELYPDSGEEISPTECDADEPWEWDYGTPDARVPVSRVPCGGCGALLHCQDTAIPGYLPSELLKNKNEVDLRAITCQRCHFLRHYNTALSVSVSPDEYPRLLSQIKDKKALVVLMVDLMDFPCSIWPNILDVIGTKRPVVVVGNKVDLLPQDSPGFLAHVENVLVRTLEYVGLAAANVVHVALVSARTGYGVDKLITKLHTAWEYKGDVYLIGCTNVGKSTLFNALLQSDYCKVKAADLIQRATTSPWPGTTLNLLKFPILRPAGWRLYERTRRLIGEREMEVEERRLRQHQARNTRTAATLIGHIGRTFRPTERETNDPFSVSTAGNAAHSGRLLGLDPKDKDYADSRWCYDTPGTVQPDQVINLLTTEELMLTLPKTLLHPRTFSLTPGKTLFIAGLGRLDYLSGDAAVRFTVFASDSLPLTVCYTHDADELYSALIGSELTAVPSGGEERLARWPGLAADEGTIRIKGEDWKTSCADVVLSSAGWVAITPGPEMTVELRGWTPAGRGVFVRPPLLRYSVNHRGSRIQRSPAYRPGAGILV